MTRKIVLVDMDHVLSAAWPRDWMINTATWDEYHAAGSFDEPVHDIRELVNSLHYAGWTIIVMTARPEKWRNLTLSWLVKHGVQADEVLMRPDEAFRPAPEIKLELVKQRFVDVKNEVAFLLEDRADVCELFHQLGITTLQVKGRQHD